jgi:hypothetical protein
MDFSLLMAYAVINTVNHEAVSALPNAPVIDPRPAGRTRRRLVRLQALKWPDKRARTRAESVIFVGGDLRASHATTLTT